MTFSSSKDFPTETHPLKGRYKLWLGVAFLLLGLVSTGLNVWVMLLEGGFSGAVVLGLLLTLIGVLYLRQPYFAIAPNRLTIYNLLGKPIQRYPFASWAQFSLEANTLYIEGAEASEGKTKVKLNAWMVNSADWERVKSLLQTQ